MLYRLFHLNFTYILATFIITYLYIMLILLASYILATFLLHFTFFTLAEEKNIDALSYSIYLQ